MKKNIKILICCHPDNIDQDGRIPIKTMGMIQNWIIERNLDYIFTRTELFSEDKNNFDKILYINPTKDKSINEFKFIKTENKCELFIRGYEWENGRNLSDNAKLNIEQAYQYLTRRICEWVSIKKNLPISFI